MMKSCDCANNVLPQTNNKSTASSTTIKIPAVDLGCCILCELCVELAPHTFQINDAGFVEVLMLDDYFDEDINEAVKNCPRDCISFE